ncbi:MAG: oligosaccharide flippase family protein [Pseudomonadota bacterium]
MNVLSRSVRSAAWVLADSWFSAVLGLLGYLVLIRLLGPETFGAMAICGLFFGAVSTFVGGALTESIQQRSTLEAGHLNTTFWSNFILCSAFALLIALSSSFIGKLFGSEHVSQILPFLALAAWISSLGAVPTALLERELQHHKLAALNALAGIPAVSVAVGMALYGFGIWSLVASVLLGACLGCAGIWMMVDWRPGFAATRQHFHDLFRFNRDTIATNILGYLDDAIPRFALAFFAGERAVGFFDMAMQISSTLSGLILGPVAEVAMNTTARLQSAAQKVRELLDKVFTLTTAIIYPATLGAIVIAPIAIPLIMGSAWFDLVMPVQIALLIGIRNASGELNIAVLRGFGDSRSPVRILALGVALQTMFIPIIAFSGVVGAVVSVTIRVFATWPLMANKLGKVCGYGFTRQISVGSAYFVASVLMAIGTYTLSSNLPADMLEISRLGVLIGFGALLYATLLLLLNQVRKILSSLVWIRDQMRAESFVSAEAF